MRDFFWMSSSSVAARHPGDGPRRRSPLLINATPRGQSGSAGFLRIAPTARYRYRRTGTATRHQTTSAAVERAVVTAPHASSPDPPQTPGSCPGKSMRPASLNRRQPNLTYSFANSYKLR